MKTEVACTSCGSAYLVDRSLLDDTGSVPCPGCGQAMLRVLRQPGRAIEPSPKPVHEPAPEAVEPPTPPSVQPAPARRFVVRPSASQATARAVAPVDPPSPAAQDRELVCPRCGLHFEPRERPAAETPADRHSVLVVEDNPYFAETVQNALRQRFEVRVAGSLSEAWSALAEGGIDLLVLDLVLGSGEESRALLEQLGEKPCPILVLTAQDETEMYGEAWSRLQRLGADDMVLKGINVGETLARKACELLGIEPDEDLT